MQIHWVKERALIPCPFSFVYSLMSFYRIINRRYQKVLQFVYCCITLCSIRPTGISLRPVVFQKFCFFFVIPRSLGWVPFLTKIVPVRFMKRVFEWAMKEKNCSSEWLKVTTDCKILLSLKDETHFLPAHVSMSKREWLPSRTSYHLFYSAQIFVVCLQK